MPDDHTYDRPWPALWAMVLGFFMILVDSTIVSVATDAIMAGLGADLGSVIWVTSAYLLAFVVPLLLSGRLGDHFGPRSMYLAGLTTFTLASLACGLAGSIEILIAARVVQGLGAAMMTPQTMAMITRTFPPDKRGVAMSLWGSVAGIALLVGPILGGLLVGTLGWEWIFFINLPVGVLALTLAYRLLPKLPTNKHKFDILGITLSGLGLFLVVFGLQEGETFDWGTIVGVISIPLMISVGLALLIGFVVWQAKNPYEPLMSLQLFRERNFSLANLAIATMSFATVGQSIPVMLFAQKSMGLSPIESGTLLVPLAITAGLLAVPAGRMVDGRNPRNLTLFGLGTNAVAVFWIGSAMTADASMLDLWVPMAVLGIGGAFVWAPLASIATRNLPPQMAGAGSGVYNMTRQVGSVFGAAAVGVLMQVLVQRNLSPVAETTDIAAITGATGALPDPLREPFANAMGGSLYLSSAVLVLGFIAAIFFTAPVRAKATA